jgi:predicted transcriptional regulator YheO
MATILEQLKYSTNLTTLMNELKAIENDYFNINKKREEAINNLYKYAALENKELTHKKAVSLIMSICHISRATVYNYLDDKHKRKYDKNHQTSESLKVRQLRKWTKAEEHRDRT